MSKAIIFRNHQNEKIYPCPYFPIGSIYMSLNNTNPSTYFGGTWVQIKDRFLLGAGSSYVAGNTGGEVTHTLTVDEMPSHNHYIKSYRGGTQWAVGYLWYRAASDSGNVEGGQSNYTNNTGGSKAHNNMPPYYVVYIWRRTA